MGVQAVLHLGHKMFSNVNTKVKEDRKISRWKLYKIVE